MNFTTENVHYTLTSKFLNLHFKLLWRFNTTNTDPVYDTMHRIHSRPIHHLDCLPCVKFNQQRVSSWYTVLCYCEMQRKWRTLMASCILMAKLTVLAVAYCDVIGDLRHERCQSAKWKYLHTKCLNTGMMGLRGVGG